MTGLKKRIASALVRMDGILARTFSLRLHLTTAFFVLAILAVGMPNSGPKDLESIIVRQQAEIDKSPYEFVGGDLRIDGAVVVRSLELDGFLDTVGDAGDGRARITGWAYDGRAKAPSAGLVVVVGDEVVAALSPGVERGDVASYIGTRGAAYAGFDYTLPVALETVRELGIKAFVVGENGRLREVSYSEGLLPVE